MADKLTPQQRQAVYDRGGKLLVSAAAGSGKTKVLVDRLLTYLTDPVDPADLDEFLIITYTKAAASELRGKIAAKLTEQIALHPENRHLQKQMQRLYLTKISTVHGFCSDILREYAYKLDIPVDFRVADENECREIRETVMTELLDQAYLENMEDPDFRTFVDTQGLGRDDRLLPDILMKVYDSARCHQDPRGWLEECIRNADVTQVTDMSQTPWGQYLLEDLREYLDAQIHVLEQCVEMARKCEGMEKPVLNLQDTLHQLVRLRNCATWDETVGARAIDYGRLSFPRKNPDPELTEQIKAARNACKKGLEKKLQGFADTTKDILKDLSQCASGVRGMVMLVERFEQGYRQAKRIRRVLDFGDLEHKMLELLLGRNHSGATAAAQEIGRRFREIMVDEYQDSNGVQDAIISALTRQRNNCFMVGDVKQSIYRFRLADPGIFLQKYQEYVPAEEAQPGQGRKVFLSHNFRSGGEIVQAVNEVFRACMTPRVGGLAYGEAEALREGIPHTLMPDPAVVLYGLQIREDTYAEEASFVADRIAEMLKNGTPVRTDTGFRPVQPEDIVILLRSPGSVGSQFQRALEERGIRCSSGAGMDLLETGEVATVRSFLQIIENPRQDIPLISTLASPIFGFTADDLAYIRSGHRKDSFYDALLETDLPKAGKFLDLLTVLRRQSRSCSLTQLLEYCYCWTGLDSIYGAMAGGEAKQANLQSFFQLAVDFEQGSLRDLNQFLEHLEVLSGRGLISAGTAATGCVTIMSIHKSKGLEFPVVFLSGLSRKFNRESLQAQILCDQDLGLGLSVADLQNRVRYPSIAKRAIMVKTARESLSEEMRVLYVALTRARDRLIMTYAARNLQGTLQDIALRMGFDGGRLLCMDADCPGDWVLRTAMEKTEAGEFFALGGKPLQTRISEIPWKICVAEASDAVCAGETPAGEEARMPKDARKLLIQAISFRYPHEAAVHTPSKQTATDRKGREKDAEAAENTQILKPAERIWRRPSFLSAQTDGRAQGNAIHRAMQYVRYENCGSLQAVQAEILRLTESGFLTPEEAALVDVRMIADFFATEPGQKLRSGVPHLREFKFSILDEGSHYGDGLEGEKVLLQGVVDCALLEPEGITIIDFKTDRVTPDSLETVTQRYAPQVRTYAEAMEKIYEMPVKRACLYFFRAGVFRDL